MLADERRRPYPPDDLTFHFPGGFAVAGLVG
jgi:hypothetical protein